MQTAVSVRRLKVISIHLDCPHACRKTGRKLHLHCVDFLKIRELQAAGKIMREAVICSHQNGRLTCREVKKNLLRHLLCLIRIQMLCHGLAVHNHLHSIAGGDIQDMISRKKKKIKSNQTVILII